MTCAYDGETRERATTRRTKRRGEWWCVFDEDEDEDDDDDDDATAWTCRWRRSEGRRKVLRRSDAGVRVEVRAGDGKTYGADGVAKLTGGGGGCAGRARRWVALRRKGRTEGRGRDRDVGSSASASEGKAVGEREMGEERAARVAEARRRRARSRSARNGATRDASDDEATLPAFGASNTNDARERTGSSATPFALTVAWNRSRGGLGKYV